MGHNGRGAFVGTPTVLLLPGSPPRADGENVVRERFSFDDASSGTSISGVNFPLFTSEKQAWTYKAALGAHDEGLTVLELSGAKELEQLLADLKAKGTTHVRINPTPGSDSEYIPIGDFIASL